MKTTVLFADINDFAEVNDLYKQCKSSCYSIGCKTTHFVFFSFVMFFHELVRNSRSKKCNVIVASSLCERGIQTLIIPISHPKHSIMLVYSRTNKSKTRDRG